MLTKLIRNLFSTSRSEPPSSDCADPHWSTQTRHADAVTLIIPSVASRAPLFNRALTVLANAQVRWKILVSDHSDAGVHHVLAAIAEGFPSLNLTITYHHPDAHFLERLVDCARRATTAYVVVHADDDFLVPTAVEACVDVLEDDATVAAAKGQIVFCTVGEADDLTANIQEGHARLEWQAPDRTLRHIACFSPTLYAVHRRAVFINAYERAQVQNGNVLFWQYLASCWTVASGRLATIDDLQCIREDNATGWRANLVKTKDYSHWPYFIVAPDFSAQLGVFKQHIAALLVAHNGDAAVMKQSIDEVCMWLVRRGMGGPAAEAKSTGETRLREALADPTSDVCGLFKYAGQALIDARHERPAVAPVDAAPNPPPGTARTGPETRVSSTAP